MVQPVLQERLAFKVRLAQLVIKVILGQLGHKAILGLQVHKAKWGRLDLLERKGIRAILARQVRKAFKAFRAYKVFKGLLVRKANKVFRVFKAQPDPLALKGILVLLALKASKGFKEKSAPLVQLALREMSAQRVLLALIQLLQAQQALWVRLAHKESRVMLDLRVRKESKAFKVSREKLARLDLKAFKAKWGRQAQQVPKAILAQLVPQVLLAHKVKLVLRGQQAHRGTLVLQVRLALKDRREHQSISKVRSPMLAICRLLAINPTTHTSLPQKAICMCGMAQHGLMLVKSLALKVLRERKVQLDRPDRKAKLAL